MLPNPYSSLYHLFARGSHKEYPKGDVIIHGYDEQTCAYYLESGYIKAYTITKYGCCNLLAIYKAGEFFPLSAILSRRADGLFYEAMTPVSVSRVTLEDLSNLIEQNKELMAFLLQEIILIFDVYKNRIQNLELRTAREKVAYRLVFLAQRFGEAHEGSIVIPVPVTHQDIADSLGLTRETASREVHRFTRLGAIEQHRHQVVIKKPDLLKREFEA